MTRSAGIGEGGRIHFHRGSRLGWDVGVRVWVGGCRWVLKDGLVSAILWLFVLNETRGVEGDGDERRGKKGGETRNLITMRDKRRDWTGCKSTLYFIFYF